MKKHSQVDEWELIREKIFMNDTQLINLKREWGSQ